MRLGGRLSAAIFILIDFETRRVPLKTAIADWGRANRYAGAKDRAFISGLCLDVLRRRGSLAAKGSVRMAILHCLAAVWQTPLAEIAAAAEDEHGPGALTDEERARLATPLSKVAREDVPSFTIALFERVFGPDTDAEIAALCQRADIDLRVNTLKADREKALKALKPVKAQGTSFCDTAARILAPPPSERAPSVTVIPSFNKGWVEVQDLGSQLAALAAGPIARKQVLDFCAGGGGKTLALAALMGNTGQVHAYDRDARRLQPLYARAKRAGVRNLQIIPPERRDASVEETLSTLLGQMDVVFLDAPCTGTGTWRRHPDTKWRLTEKQLESRMAEQDLVLAEGARFVRPGGRLVYVTCSVFAQENEDRLDCFLGEQTDFSPVPATHAIFATGLVPDKGKSALEQAAVWNGYALRLSPERTNTDGFFISVLARE